MPRPKAWITPTQAIDLMSKKLSFYEPEALIIWSQDKLLRSRAKHIEYTDDWQYFTKANQYETYIWHGKVEVVWSAAKLTSIINTDAFDEQWNISGIEFLRNDVLRCIALAKGENEPQEKVDKKAVIAWVQSYIAERGIENVRKRDMEKDARCVFPNQRGTISTVRAFLGEMRAKHENRQTAQN
jgi:hypothetical protein